MRFINALEVPDMVAHSHSAREQVEPLIGTVVEGLDQGGKFFIYPSGKIERNGLEQIGSTRAVPDILARRPDTTVVLVRTVGVWGSMTTFAPTGKEPSLPEKFVQALGILAANLIFFTPRRRIKMTIEVVDPKTLPGLTREKLNPCPGSLVQPRAFHRADFRPVPFSFRPAHLRLSQAQRRAAKSRSKKSRPRRRRPCSKSSRKS